MAERTFKEKLWRGVIFLLLVFVALFIFRFIYTYTDPGSDAGDDYVGSFSGEFQSSRKNYASDSYKYSKQTESKAAMSTVSVEQKYEKVATLKSKTDKFEEAEKAIRKTVENFEAIIQFEKNAGNKGNRMVHMSIGVPPAAFDSFVTKVKTIGKIQSISIEKTDKTSEYKNLNAKRLSLETVRASLLELKKQNGKIDEFISLQDKILEVEQQLQDIGVQLGDFSAENEFCTVNFSLVEGKFVSASVTHRVKVSLEWTINFYLKLLAIFTFCFFGVWLFLAIVLKMRDFMAGQKPK
ncbi:MAG: hypothetical protein JWO06_647 [Bacteroidota bacterium]|nr:hypothetical protein [Bacteroidota bacterium]